MNYHFARGWSWLYAKSLPAWLMFNSATRDAKVIHAACGQGPESVSGAMLAAKPNPGFVVDGVADGSGMTTFMEVGGFATW